MKFKMGMRRDLNAKGNSRARASEQRALQGETCVEMARKDRQHLRKSRGTSLRILRTIMMMMMVVAIAQEGKCDSIGVERQWR